MRLATFNILHGRTFDGGPASADRLAEACALLEADVLALQEVDKGQPRSGGVDQAAVVAERMGAAAWRFEP
ncbi:MAG TPA: endonuclease/exonuclease/phosphatase family protein, partial [Acidimicrobiales bacterium]|nr:endonuclease/exonuclease/phosphatase family protein [Acidimicrobiales bacterium]